MPKTIPDEEYTFLQNRRQVADFVESIYNDPQLNREAKALIKRKYPNLQIPDYDIETKVTARLDQEKQEREDKERADKERAEEERFKNLRKETQEKYGFTDDAMGRLEQLMIDRNIGDYEAGAMLMASREPKASEPTHGPQTHWEHEKQDGFADIAKDPEGWGRDQLMRAIRTDQERARSGR